MKDDTSSLSPDLLLHGYANGIFPMAEHRDDPEVFWVDPKHRGVIPLDGFHISHSLAKAMRKADFSVTFDHDFAAVLDACADREETWINASIRSLYLTLHDRGFGHSVEVRRNGTLIGGSYGIALGGAYFGESMFSRATNGSKIALAYLIDRLRSGGFVLFDTQFLTPHLASLGAIEIPRADYRKKLREALQKPAEFDARGAIPSAQDVIQRSTQTS